MILLAKDQLNPLAEISAVPKPALGLLPAVHDADPEAAPNPLPAPSACPGSVFTNPGATALVLPGGLGRGYRLVQPSENFASDGRLFYLVKQEPATHSYYPRAFERVLQSYHFSPEGLTAGSEWTFKRKFHFRTVGANTAAVWCVIFELGHRTSETEPATLGSNLLNITWLTPPAMQQQIVLTDVACSHTFGFTVRRSSTGFTAWTERYGGSYTVATPPTNPDFFFRIRLGLFDTENSQTNPAGYVAYYMGQP